LHSFIFFQNPFYQLQTETLYLLNNSSYVPFLYPNNQYSTFYFDEFGYSRQRIHKCSYTIICPFYLLLGLFLVLFLSDHWQLTLVLPDYITDI
jgi:hypothetical protein